MKTNIARAVRAASLAILLDRAEEQAEALMRRRREVGIRTPEGRDLLAKAQKKLQIAEGLRRELDRMPSSAAFA